MKNSNIAGSNITKSDLLENIINEVKEGIIIVDLQGIIQFANPIAQTVFGSGVDSLVGLDFGIPIIDNPFEFCLLDKRSTILDMQASKINSSSGLAYLLMFNDITGQVRIEKTCEEQEQLLLEIGEIARVGGWRFDIETERFLWSPICREIHEVDGNYDPTIEDAISFFPDDAQEKMKNAFSRCKEKGESFDLKLPFITANGDRLWVHSIGYPVFDNEKVIAINGVFQDITSLHETFNELIKSQTRTQKLLDNAIDGFAISEVIYDEQHEPIDYKIIDINRAFEEILGIPREQAVGHTSIEVMPAVTKAPVWKMMQQVARTGTPQNLEFYFDALGRYFFVSVFQPYDGQLATIFRDITERIQVDEALQKSEKKYRQLFENSINGFSLHEIILDEEGKPVNFRFLDVNKAFTKHTGIKAEDAIGKTAREVLPGIEDTELIETYGRIALTGESKRFETYFQPHDRYYMITAFSPEPLKFATVFSDISDRIRAEQAQQRSENQYRLLFENASYGFVLVEMVEDEQGNLDDFIYLKMNQAFEKEIGLNAEVIRNKRATEVTPKILKTNLPDELLKVHLSKTPNSYEIFIPGDDRYFLVSSYFTLEGQVASIVSDITDQRRVEREIIQSEDKYRTLFEAMAQGVIYNDADGIITSVNPGAEHILGGRVEDFLGKSLDDPEFICYRMNNEILPSEQIPAMVALKTGKKVEHFSLGYFNAKRKEIVWLEVSAIPQFRKGEDRPYKVFTTFLEITDQVRVQKALEERIKELRCLSQVSAIIQENRSPDTICSMITNEIVQGMQFPELVTVQIKLNGKVFSSSTPFKETRNKLSAPIQIQDRVLGKISACYLEDKPFMLPEELNLLEGIAERLGLWYHQRKTQELLEESERRFRNAIMNAPNPIMIHADDGEVIDVNEAWVTNSGYSRKEITSVRRWMELAHPNQHRQIRRIINENFEDERSTANGEYPVHTKSGEILHWYFNTAPLGNLPDGRVIVITVAIDITDRIDAEEEKDQYYDRITALREIDKAMVSTLNLNQVLDLITSHLGNVIQFDSMSVMLLNEDIIKIIACKGFNHPEEILKLKFPSEPGFPNYEIIKERKPVSVVNISQEFPKFAQPGEPFVKGEIKSWLGVPMTNMKDVIGMFAIDRLEEKPFSEEDVEIAMQYANRAAIAITNAQLFERITNQVEKLEILRRIDATITISTDLDDALKAILSEVKNGLKVDVASVFLYQEEDKTLNFAQSVGYKTKGHPKTKVNVGQGYVGTVAKSEAPLFIPVVDLSDDGYRYPFNMKKEGIVSYYGFPLVSKGKMQGVLQILSRTQLEPDADWIDFAQTLARQMAIAVDNLTLFTDLEMTNVDLREAYDATIEGWAHALEIRDKETEGHSRRVEKLTGKLAKEFGYGPEELVHIRRGVLLHDIGKMGVPDHILHKPGPLDEDEWVIMRKHPVFAYDMLKSIDYLKPALIIPHYHHERWDGSGYPEGFVGEKIPLEARIFAVVDAWDALTSDRPYRKAWTQEETREYLRQQAGKEFDPQVVKVFLEMIMK